MPSEGGGEVITAALIKFLLIFISTQKLSPENQEYINIFSIQVCRSVRNHSRIMQQAQNQMEKKIEWSDLNRVKNKDKEDKEEPGVNREHRTASTMNSTHRWAHYCRALFFSKRICNDVTTLFTGFIME